VRTVVAGVDATPPAEAKGIWPEPVEIGSHNVIAYCHIHLTESGGESLGINSVLAFLDGQIGQARRVLLPLG
jgi:hypothetical protein